MDNRSWKSKNVIREIGYMAEAEFPSGYLSSLNLVIFTGKEKGE